MRFIVASLLSLGVLTSWAAAQDDMPYAPPVDHEQSSTAAAAEPHAPEHPVLPQDAQWAGLMVMFIIAMFVAAAAVGILAVDMNKAEEVPDAHGHGHDDHGHGHDTHGDAHGAHDSHGHGHH